MNPLKGFMKSIYKLNWSDEALKNLKGILSYLEENWTEKEISRFAQNLDQHLSLIIENPRLFPKVGNASVRKAVLSKHSSVFYVLDSKEIQILFIFDNRQNPEKLNIK